MKIFKTMTLVLAFFPLALSSHAKITADTVLRKSDAIRNPQVDYTVHVKVTSFKPKKDPKMATYRCWIKGREEAVVQTLTPPIDKGQVLLMSGNNFWGLLPKVSKPLRISLQERLIGEVANGDLARVNYYGDYKPKISSVKKIRGKKYYVLNLKAKTDDVTYGRVVLWVKGWNFYPHYAEFYAFSGRKLKTCKYAGFKEFGGAVRPTRLIMKDAVNTKRYSVLDYSDIKIAPLPSKYFKKEYMKRLAE